MPIDVLIVGQGLAGSLLAWELIRRQFRVMVIDSGGENASQAAAGLINPVTGQRLVKSADVEHLYPVAMACYQQLADQFKQAFFVPLPMLRILKNPRERQIADERLNDSAYQAFLQNHALTIPGLNSPFGVLQQQKTGYLLTRPLLTVLRDFFLAKASYRQARMDYDDVIVKPHLRWRDLQPKHIVFCEGYQAMENPWFGKLPFQPAKGEILGCRAGTTCPQQILNFGKWLIPLDRQHFKIGATFESGIIDARPTEEARRRLLQELATVCPDLHPVEVLVHQAGIRPTTLDKQPFIGPHPLHKQMHIFNGFGAKGSLAIPWSVQRFVDALKGHQPLPPSSHIQRYDETYFPV